MLFCYGELGLKGSDIIELTLFEFFMLREGFNRREELKWVHTRELMTIINNTSMGCKPITPEKIKPLNLDSRIQHDENASIDLFKNMVK